MTSLNAVDLDFDKQRRDASWRFGTHAPDDNINSEDATHTTAASINTATGLNTNFRVPNLTTHTALKLRVLLCVAHKPQNVGDRVMARGNRGTTTTANGDRAFGSAEPSASPSTATSPARSSKTASSKKRKRSDNTKSPKRSKLKSQEGQQDHSAGDESDDDEDYKKPLADVKLEDDETMAGDPLDAPGPSLDSSEAERILLILERYVS